MENKERGLEELKTIVGEDNYSDEKVDLIPYMRDPYSALMGRDIVLPDCVVLPDCAEDVQAIVMLANRYDLPIYPRSFGANLAGCALPYRGGIVIDLKRMNKIHEINADTMTATIEPGVTWGGLGKAAKAKGLDAIQIGGPYCVGPVGNFLFSNITHYATSYSADRVVTLEAVLPNGEIVKTGSQCTKIGAELNPYFRYAYGPDVAGLFRGSMGNYGIITRMVMRLRPLGKIEQAVLYGFNDMESALKTMRNVERLEITRMNVVYNKYMLMHVPLTPEEQRDDGERKRVLESLPPYLMIPGIKGDERLIKLYKEIIGEEVEKEKGYVLDVPDEIREPIIRYCEGGSDVATRIYAPFSGFGVAVGCLPVMNVGKMTQEVIELAKQHDIKHPVSHEFQCPGMAAIPYDRCSTVYVELDVLYDPNEKEEFEKVFGWVREAFKMMVIKYGATHVVGNKTLLDRVCIPAYSKILKGIKSLVDPKGIMMSGGPYTFE